MEIVGRGIREHRVDLFAGCAVHFENEIAARFQGDSFGSDLPSVAIQEPSFLHIGQVAGFEQGGEILGGAPLEEPARWKHGGKTGGQKLVRSLEQDAVIFEVAPGTKAAAGHWG